MTYILFTLCEKYVKKKYLDERFYSLAGDEEFPQPE